MRAHGAIRPAEVFEKRSRGIFSEKLGCGAGGASAAAHVTLAVNSSSARSPHSRELSLDQPSEALEGLGAGHAKTNPLVHVLVHHGRVRPAGEAALGSSWSFCRSRATSGGDLCFVRGRWPDHFQMGLAASRALQLEDYQARLHLIDEVPQPPVASSTPELSLRQRSHGTVAPRSNAITL